MYELPVSGEEYKEQMKKSRLIDPWRGGALYDQRPYVVSTEDKMKADQSNYQEPTEDQVKIVKSKDLLTKILEYIPPVDTYEQTTISKLVLEIKKFIKEA